MQQHQVTFDTNGRQAEFAEAMKGLGWDDHYTDENGQDRRLPNTTMQSSNFAGYADARASVRAAAIKVRTDHSDFRITHLAIGRLIKAEGGAVRTEVKAAKVTPISQNTR